MKYLRTTALCPWGTQTFASAAYHGHLDIMKWLLENGCPLSKLAFWCAVHNGKLENVKWLHSVGCPWGKEIFNIVERHCTKCKKDGYKKHKKDEPEIMTWVFENLKYN